MAPLSFGTNTWRGRGTVAALALVVLAVAVPQVSGWHVGVGSFPPLFVSWQPRLGPGTLPAVVLALAAARWAPGLAARLAWRRLLGTVFAAGLAWLLALAFVDGRAGVGARLATSSEYLPTARGVHDIGAMLHHFVEHIPATASPSWPTHVAGHPPGALLFFVLLVRLGLGGAFATGLVVTVIAATVPVAVLLTLRRLGVEPAARRAAPLLTLGPAAIWMATSADAVFAAVAAWAICALSMATGRGRVWAPTTVAWGVLGGVLLGLCAYLSYGLVLIGVLALGVGLAARDLRPAPAALAGIGVVVATFTVAGFRWWDALPVLRERYYAGVAQERPAAYWGWADLAALTLAAGIALGPSVAVALSRTRATVRRRTPDRPVVVLTVAALGCVVIADLSFMSKAEVERIWLPFVPWLLIGSALLPSVWRRRLFAAGLVLAVVVQSLWFTTW